MGHFKLPILVVLSILVTCCLSEPSPEPNPEPKPQLLIPILQNLLYSIITPLEPLICELIDLLNGLLGLVRSIIFDLLLNYILGDLINGGEVAYDSIFNLFPI